MVRITVYLEEETALALRQLASVRRRSQSDLIRDSLRCYTRGANRPAAQGIGKYRSCQRDIAQRAKEILADEAKRGRWR